MWGSGRPHARARAQRIATARSWRSPAESRSGGRSRPSGPRSASASWFRVQLDSGDQSFLPEQVPKASCTSEAMLWQLRSSKADRKRPNVSRTRPE